MLRRWLTSDARDGGAPSREERRTTPRRAFFFFAYSFVTCNVYYHLFVCLFVCFTARDGGTARLCVDYVLDDDDEVYDDDCTLEFPFAVEKLLPKFRTFRHDVQHYVPSDDKFFILD